MSKKFLDITGLNTFWSNVKSWLSSNLKTVNGESLIGRGDIAISGGSGDSSDSDTSTLAFTCPDNLIVKQSSSTQTVTAYCYLTEGKEDVSVRSYSLSVSIPSSMSGVSLQANTSNGTNIKILVFLVTANATPSGDITVTCTYGDSTIERDILVTTIEKESDITITGDDNGYITASGHTIDVSDLIGTLEKVASKYDAGYYYSSSASNNVPVDPVYWGTSSEGFELDDDTHQYLWYTNDGVTWNLVMQQISSSEETGYYYICTTLCGVYITSDGISHKFPAGFYTYMYSPTTSTKAQYAATGENYYITFTSTLYEATGVTSDDIAELLAKLQRGPYTSIVQDTLPTNYSEYHYVWRISVDDWDNLTDYTKWGLYKTMSGVTNSDIVTTIQAYVANRASYPALKIITYDGSNVTFILPSDGSITDSGTTLIGSVDNWGNETWVKYFLMWILYNFLNSNEAFYGEKLGFNFNNSTAVININGYGGRVDGQLGTAIAPSSTNNLAAQNFTSLDGSLYGHAYTNSSLIYKVDFAFSQVCIGMKSDIYLVAQSLTNEDAIKTILDAGTSGIGPLYDITSWSTNSYAIVTTLSTGKRTLFKYTNGVWGGTELDS